MSFQTPQPHPCPSFEGVQQPSAHKPGWSTGKKVGVALGGLVVVGAAFFAGGTLGVGIGYNNAKADLAASFQETFAEDFAAPVTDGYDTDMTGADSLSVYPVALAVGDSVDVPCSMYSPEDGVCMTLTLTELNPNAVCSSSYVDPGRFVALTFEASMPAEADPDFSSPFRSFPWSVVTDDNQMTGTDTAVSCDLSSNDLDLMAEFPGYSASGTAWLAIPDNAAEVHFEADHEQLFSVPLG